MQTRRLVLAGCYLAALLAAQLPHGHADPREAALLASGGMSTGGTPWFEAADLPDSDHDSAFCAACHFRVTLAFCPEAGLPAPSCATQPALSPTTAGVACTFPRPITNRGPPGV